MYPDRFYRHDGVHTSNHISGFNIPQPLKAELRSHYLDYRDKVPVEGDRRFAFEFVYFLATHELYGGPHLIIQDRNEIASRFQTEELRKVLRDPDWFGTMVPKWATESDANAEKFLKMSADELKQFSSKYYENK
jgi:hypothetical protein